MMEICYRVGIASLIPDVLFTQLVRLRVHVIEYIERTDFNRACLCISAFDSGIRMVKPIHIVQFGSAMK